MTKTNSTTACRMTEGGHKMFDAACTVLGETAAIGCGDLNGSFGSAREAAIAAFTRDFDKQAATSMGSEA